MPVYWNLKNRTLITLAAGLLGNVVTGTFLKEPNTVYQTGHG